jgi:hypothetical protein
MGMQGYVSDTDVCCRAWLPGSDDSDSDVRSGGSNSDGSGDSGDSDSNPDSDGVVKRALVTKTNRMTRRALITEATRPKSKA